MSRYKYREVDGFAEGTLAYMKFIQGPEDQRRGHTRLAVYTWGDVEKLSPGHKNKSFFVFDKVALVKLAMVALGAAGEDKLVGIIKSGGVAHGQHATKR